MRHFIRLSILPWLLLAGAYFLLHAYGPNLTLPSWEAGRWGIYRLEGEMIPALGGDLYKFEARWPVNQRSYLSLAAGRRASTGRLRDVTWRRSRQYEVDVGRGGGVWDSTYKSSMLTVFYLPEVPKMLPWARPWSFSSQKESGAYNLATLTLGTSLAGDDVVLWRPMEYGDTSVVVASEGMGLRLGWRRAIISADNRVLATITHDQASGILLEMQDLHRGSEGRMVLERAVGAVFYPRLGFWIASLALFTGGYLLARRRFNPSPGFRVRWTLATVYLAFPLFDVARWAGVEILTGGRGAMIAADILSLPIMIIGLGPWGAPVLLRLVGDLASLPSLTYAPWSALALVLWFWRRGRTFFAPTQA